MTQTPAGNNPQKLKTQKLKIKSIKTTTPQTAPTNPLFWPSIIAGILLIIMGTGGLLGWF